MSKAIKLSTRFFLIAAVVFLQNLAVASNMQPLKTDRVFSGTSVEGITLPDMDVVMGYASVAWTSMTGTGPYTVTVMDFTTSTLHSQTYTTGTTTELTGLIYGHRYYINVSRGSQADFIIIDIIDIG